MPGGNADDLQRAVVRAGLVYNVSVPTHNSLVLDDIARSPGSLDSMVMSGKGGDLEQSGDVASALRWPYEPARPLTRLMVQASTTAPRK